jgi:hypothetical protein
VQGWTNCGNNRCGITNNDNGYEELGWALVDKINTNPFTYMEGAITDTGIFKKSSDPHQLAKLLRWNTDSDAAGRWVTMLTARSYISAGANGLVMLFPRPSSYRPPDYPKRVMAMWQGYTGGGFMNHHVPMTWMVDMIQTRRGFVTLWGGNSNGGMGLQNDGNGWTGMDMLKVDPAHSYVRIGIGNINNGGLEHPFENEFTDLLGYYWDLPSAGTYTLTATVRAYTTAAGWAKVKLSVADLYSDATSELLVNDVDDVKYGESTRLLISWDQKKFERMEHAVSFTWSGIKVTGGMRVIMQGMRSDGGSGAIGTSLLHFLLMPAFSLEV